MTAQTKVAPTFRVAGQDDVNALVDLVQLAYRGGKSSVGWKNESDLVAGPRITADQMAAIVGDVKKTVLIAELPPAPQKMVGCILVDEHENEAHIGMFAVDPSLQNAGLGRAMVQAAEHYSVKALGKSRATMSVLSVRQELLAWYARLGYQKTGETEPFFGPESGQTPLKDNLHFILIEKSLV